MADFVSLLKSKGFVVEYLTPTSWIAVIRNFMLPERPEELDELWSSHPVGFQKIKMFGKDIEIPRYQQAYGRSYRFSGIETEALEETALIERIQRELNVLSEETEDFKFNMCLCNWYEPEHYIGPHSDDTRQLVPGSPIACLSWGATRVFTLTSKAKTDTCSVVKKKRITINSGDLIIMGGDCQGTHKHEIEKLKKGEARGNRVSLTFRCFV